MRGEMDVAGEEAGEAENSRLAAEPERRARAPRGAASASLRLDAGAAIDPRRDRRARREARANGLRARDSCACSQSGARARTGARLARDVSARFLARARRAARSTQVRRELVVLILVSYR